MDNCNNFTMPTHAISLSVIKRNWKFYNVLRRRGGLLAEVCLALGLQLVFKSPPPIFKVDYPGSEGGERHVLFL